MFSQLNVIYPKRAITGTTPVASQSTTVSTAAIAPTGYTSATAGGGGVTMVTFDVQTNHVRVRWDGTDPTGDVGHILYAGTNYTWPVALYNAAKFIRITAASADATIFASPLNN